MSEILHGRYRVETWGKWRPTIAVDVETGARVLLPEDGARTTFLSRARMRRVAERFSEIRDPRFVRPISLAPVVVPCPSHWTSHSIAPFDAALRITVAEAVDAALELIELTAIAARAGARVSADDAILARDATGELTVRVVAPTAAGVDPDPLAALFGLQLASRCIGGIKNPVTGLTTPTATAEAVPQALRDALIAATPDYDWRSHPSRLVLPRSPRRALEAVAAFGRRPRLVDEAFAAIEQPVAPRSAPDFDLDLALAWGEAELADTSRAEWTRQQTRFDLAVLLHHRACIATSRGEDAIEPLERAVALDAHPEHLTTLAIAHERRGENERARDLHDRAVAAIPRYSVTSEETEADRDHRSSFPRRAARSLEARGAFRATHGDREGALADLRASLAMHPSASVERRLAKLGA